MRTLALFFIGLVFGGGIGFVTAAGMGVTFDGHDHDNSNAHAAMDHDVNHDVPIDVDAAAAPEISIEVLQDLVSGYNLHVVVDQFEFSPQNASLEHIPGEGHAHIYVNGVKQGRLYGPWVHFDHLPKGQVTVKVSLNANNHSPLAIAGQQIAASTTLVVQ